LKIEHGNIIIIHYYYFYHAESAMLPFPEHADK